MIQESQIGGVCPWYGWDALMLAVGIHVIPEPSRYTATARALACLGGALEGDVLTIEVIAHPVLGLG